MFAFEYIAIQSSYGGFDSPFPGKDARGKFSRSTEMLPNSSSRRLCSEKSKQLIKPMLRPAFGQFIFVFRHYLKEGPYLLEEGATHYCALHSIPINESGIIQSREMGMVVFDEIVFHFLVLTSDLTFVARIILGHFRKYSTTILMGERVKYLIERHALPSALRGVLCHRGHELCVM